MSLHIVRFDGSQMKTWDDFVATSRNGTFFHTRKFLSYHPEDRFTDHSLLFYDDQRLVAVLTAAEKTEEGKKMLVSHPGASYGGLVLSPHEGMMMTGTVLDQLRAYAKEQGFSSVLFLRLTPPSVRRALSDDQEYSMFHRGWKHVRAELASSIPLSGHTEASFLESIDRTCRNKVNQAERAGVTAVASTDFETFWKILEATLESRHKAKPTHTIDEIKRLHALAPKNVHLHAAMYQGKMIGGIVWIALHDRTAYTLYMAQDYEHVKLRSVNLLVADLGRLCIRDGRTILHLGISTEEGGTVVNEGLFTFKESFGAQPVRRDSYELIL